MNGQDLIKIDELSENARISSEYIDLIRIVTPPGYDDNLLQKAAKHLIKAKKALDKIKFNHRGTTY